MHATPRCSAARRDGAGPARGRDFRPEDPARGGALALLLLLAALTPSHAARPPFSVQCVKAGSERVGGVAGDRYCCSFTNPSRTLPIVNHQLSCANFQPLLLNGDITPRCLVDAYVGPLRTKSFCFVNDASAGVPSLEGTQPAHPVASLQTTTSASGIDLVCRREPKLERFGRDVLATFFCNLKNNLPQLVTGLVFDCTNVRPIYTRNLNPDCTYQGTLQPAGRDGSTTTFSFSILANDVTMDLISILPTPPSPPSPPPAPGPEGAAFRGWWSSTGVHSANASPGNYFTGTQPGFGEYRSYFVFNVPSSPQPFVAAELKVQSFDISVVGGASETFVLSDFAGSVSALTTAANGAGNAYLFADLGNGTEYGTRDFTTSDANQDIVITLNAAAVAAINLSMGQQFVIGGKVTTLGADGQGLFGGSQRSTPASVKLTLS